MKLLLTSAGLKNKLIINELKDLVDGEIRTVFIPTAANIQEGDKSWLVRKLTEFQKLGFIDIVDIASLPLDQILKRLNKCNVIVGSGGNVGYLMDQFKKSGLDKEFSKVINEKIYVGISAGSILMSEKLWCGSDYFFTSSYEMSPKGLSFINFNIRPHWNSIDFPKVTLENINIIAKKNPSKVIYAIDDNCAISINGQNIKVVGHGNFKIFNTLTKVYKY